MGVDEILALLLAFFIGIVVAVKVVAWLLVKGLAILAGWFIGWDKDAAP